MTNQTYKIQMWNDFQQTYRIMPSSRYTQKEFQGFLTTYKPTLVKENKRTMFYETETEKFKVTIMKGGS